MGTRFSPFYNLRKITTLKVVRKKEKILITNQEKQTEEHKKWVQFVQRLIDDLKSVTIDDIEVLYNSRADYHQNVSIYWNSFSHKLSFSPFRGETYCLGVVFTGDNFNFFKNDVELIVTQRASLLEGDFKKKLLDHKVLKEKVMGMDNHTCYFDDENYFNGIYPLGLLTPDEKRKFVELIYNLEFERSSKNLISKDYHLMSEFQSYQPILDNLIDEDTTTIIDFLVSGKENSSVVDLYEIFKRLFNELCYSVEAKQKIINRIFDEIIDKLQLKQFQTSKSFIQLNKTITFSLHLIERFRNSVHSKDFLNFTQFLLRKIDGHLHIKNLLALSNVLKKFNISSQPFLNENVKIIEMDDEYINSLFNCCTFPEFLKSLNQDCFTNYTFVLRITKSSSSNYFQFLDRTIRFLRMIKKENFLGRFEFHLADDLIEDFKFISQRPELFLSDKISKEQADEIISLFKV